MTKKKRIYLIISILIIVGLILIVHNNYNRKEKEVFLEEKPPRWSLGKKIDYEFKDYRDTLNLEEMEIIARQIASAYFMNETIKEHYGDLSSPIESDIVTKYYSTYRSSVQFYIHTRQTAEGRNIVCSLREYYKCTDSYVFYMRSVKGFLSMPEMGFLFSLSINKRGQAYLLYGFQQNDVDKLIKDQLKEVNDKETALEVFNLYALSGILGSLLQKDHDYDSSAFNNYKDIVKEKTIVEKENAFIINASFKKEIGYTPQKTTYEYNNVDLIISKKGKVSHKIIKQRIGLEDSHYYQ
ncbi:MAG: hypothetical protein WCS69_13300 [Ignavibacteriaceae bacterium]|jgi:hypothetical protein